jgi:hypothetical protein
MSITISNVDSVRKLIEKVKYKHKDNLPPVVIFTNGNSWYIDTLVNNLLKSMSIYELNRKIAVFSSDKEGESKCLELNFEHFSLVEIPHLNVDKCMSNTDSKTRQYTALSFIKIVLTKFILDLGYVPLYLDPDMAFKKPAIDDLLGYLDSKDFVCAGTPDYINSNILIASPYQKITDELFTLTVNSFQSVINDSSKYGDEDFLRPQLIEGTFSCVNTEEYPPGCDAVRYKNKARIIHSNCVNGLDNKISLLKEAGAWFLYTDIISSKFIVPVKDIYPPLLEGDLFEMYFYNYIKNSRQCLNRTYINATWTNLYCNSLFKNIEFECVKLQQELDSLPRDGKYFTVVQFDEGVKYHKLPPDTIVFGCCDGDVPIPLTYNNKFIDSIDSKKWLDKTILCSFIGGHTHSLRKTVYNSISNLIQKYPTDYLYNIGNADNIKSFIDITSISKFSLAPRGFGRSSFRFFEILKLGSVPIYIWDDKNWLPFKDKIDYTKLCISLNISDIDKLDTILRNITQEEYENMRSYYKSNSYLFTYKGMADEILRNVN